jgi:hypothetical protein
MGYVIMGYHGVRDHGVRDHGVRDHGVRDRMIRAVRERGREGVLKPEAVASADLNHIILM